MVGGFNRGDLSSVSGEGALNKFLSLSLYIPRERGKFFKGKSYMMNSIHETSSSMQKSKMQLCKECNSELLPVYKNCNETCANIKTSHMQHRKDIYLMRQKKTVKL